MKVHAVVDNDIHPPRFGSAQRSFGIFRGLARRHAVEALCVVPYRNRAARDETAERVRIHRRRAWYTAVAWRLERLGIAPLVLAARGHAARGKQWLRTLPGEPDVLLLGPWFGGLLPASGARLNVYLAQNVEADHFRATAPRVLAASHWANRVRALEADLARRAGLVAVCSDEDAARMQELHGVDASNIVVAPNGWDETTIRPPSEIERVRARDALAIPRDAHVGLFLGSDAPTNRTAVAALVDRVMPAASSGGALLIVAGDAGRVLAGRKAPWLRVVPARDDVLPLLHAADVGLNPVVSGGGSNVKVPTYLGAGLAVLTTAHGLRGYAELRPSVVVAALEEFADAWATRPRGWGDGVPRPAALDAFAWGAIGEALGEAIEARLEGRARSRPDAGGTAAEGRRALA